MTDPLPTHRQPLPLSDRDSNTAPAGCVRLTLVAVIAWLILLGGLALECLS